MIITLVMDQYGAVNNGTTVTTMRFAEVLKNMGIQLELLQLLQRIKK